MHVRDTIPTAGHSSLIILGKDRKTADQGHKFLVSQYSLIILSITKICYRTNLHLILVVCNKINLIYALEYIL